MHVDKKVSATEGATRIKGMEKVVERMQKAREEAEFKKKMTERSDFSAATGLNKAKQIIKAGSTKEISFDAFVNATEKNKVTAFGKIDGS